MPSLSDKLKALGVTIGLPPGSDRREGHPPEEARHDSASDLLTSKSLDEALSGHLIKNAQGETYLVEAHYPSGYQHGRTGLLGESKLKVLAAWAGNPDLGGLAPASFAFMDTETTGLNGGTGTYAFLIGVGRFVESEFHLAQFFMRDPFEEPAQLLALEEFLAPCQAIVTFNGKAFDAPLINTRYLIHGWRSPLLDLGHIDLLHLARRLWRNRLPSRTLANLEVQILGTERTEEDIPGWAIPQIYFDYLRSKDPTPLSNVFYHNAMDVVSLAALFNHLAGLLADPLSASIEHGVDLIALARLYEDLGETELAIELYLQGLEFGNLNPHFSQASLPASVLLDALDRLALIYKRRQNYALAVAVWEKAASHQHIQAYIELSKYYEHHQRDYALALFWTQSALNLVDSYKFGHKGERLLWVGDLQPRLERLQRKISHSSRQS